jgi:uncharacterized protein YjiS (DUF1127 family)
MTNIIDQDNGNFYSFATARISGLASTLCEAARPASVILMIDKWLKRGTVVKLGNLDDRQLRDIGLDRSDIYWALKLPISEDAEALLMSRIRCPDRKPW